MRGRGSRERSRRAAKRTVSTLPASASSSPGNLVFLLPRLVGGPTESLGAEKRRGAFRGQSLSAFQERRGSQPGKRDAFQEAAAPCFSLLLLSSVWSAHGRLSSLARRGSSLPRLGVGLKGARSTFESGLSPPRPPSFPERGAVFAFGNLASGGGWLCPSARAPFFYRVGGEPRLATEEEAVERIGNLGQGPLALLGAEACRLTDPPPQLVDYWGLKERKDVPLKFGAALENG